MLSETEERTLDSSNVSNFDVKFECVVSLKSSNAFLVWKSQAYCET